MPSTPTTTIETAYGPVEVAAIADDNVSIRCGRIYNDNYELAPVVINRVEYGFDIRIERNRPGRVVLSDSGWSYGYTGYRVDPQNWRRMNDRPSDSAYRKIREGVVLKVIEWLDANPEFLAEGDDAATARALASLDAQIEAKMQEVAELQAERRRIIVACA